MADVLYKERRRGHRGLKRGLSEIPSAVEGTAAVLGLAPDSAGEPLSAQSIPLKQPARPVRKRKSSATKSATGKQKGGRKSASRKRTKSARTKNETARAEQSRQRPERAAGGQGAGGAVPGIRPSSDKLRDAGREFYAILGRGVADLFMRTVKQAVSRGIGVEEVIPQVFRKILKGYGDLPGKLRDRVTTAFEGGFGSDLLDPDTWQGFYYLLRSSLEMAIDSRARRRRGDYEVDPFGLDEEFLFRVRPLFDLLYKKWWRVGASGIANVPESGRVLFVANHSGVLPYDGGMVATAIWNLHPNPRLLRALHLEWFVSVPFVAPFLQRTGQVMATPQNGEQLLAKDHMVTVFPEGVKGVGKLYGNRYRLARFGRAGYIKVAIRAQAPLVPVAVVGAEEIHPVLFRADIIGKPLGFPMMPITATFPWLGPFGLIPFPSKWYIHFLPPIDMSVYDPEDANDFHLVSQLSDHVRTMIQRRIRETLRKRPGIFRGPKSGALNLEGDD